MKADYARIAAKYDDNEVRRLPERDEALLSAASASEGRFRVLDLACGTGLYVRGQSANLPGGRVEWTGLDRSPEMLRLAAARCPSARFALGTAERLPFAARAFDYVAVNFAFHHFGDKPAALGEIGRALAPGGALRVRNISPESMRGWWIYRYFPEAVEIDAKRFWPEERTVKALGALGFEARLSVERCENGLKLSTVLEHALRRDVSELDLLDDAAYETGLARIREDLESGVEEIADENALSLIVARRKGA